jgi:hypothetical protein
MPSASVGLRHLIDGKSTGKTQRRATAEIEGDYETITQHFDCVQHTWHFAERRRSHQGGFEWTFALALPLSNRRELRSTTAALRALCP